MAAARMHPPALPPLPSSEPERLKQINRTKIGILLLLVGTAIGWIPTARDFGIITNLGGAIFVNFVWHATFWDIGFVPIVIGAFLVILGWTAFPPSHRRNIKISIVLFFIGIVIDTIARGMLLFGLNWALTRSYSSDLVSRADLQNAVNNYVIVALVGAIVGGLAFVFFTYSLQNQKGLLLLFAGYGASIGVQIAIFIIANQILSSVLDAAFPGGTYNPTAASIAAQRYPAEPQWLGLLWGIPALLYTAATYIAWNRIKKGEIPASLTPPNTSPAPAAPIQPR
jgi:hypothetical protein